MATRRRKGTRKKVVRLTLKKGGMGGGPPEEPPGEEISKAEVLEAIKAKYAAWRNEKRAEVEYQAAELRVKERRDPLAHVVIPTCRWRPGMATGEVSTVMLNLYSEGHTIADIRRRHPAYPTVGVIHAWRRDDPEFAAAWERAVDAHLESRAQLAIDVASGSHRVFDDAVTVNRDRLHSEAVMRAAQMVAARHHTPDSSADNWAEIVASAEEEERNGNGNGDHKKEE